MRKETQSGLQDNKVNVQHNKLVMLELNKIYRADCLDGMLEIADNSIDCCPTSPPYWGLRDYGIGATEWPEITFRMNEYTEDITVPAMKCCLGLELTPVQHISHIVHVMRKLRRILKPTGSVWFNYGDGYAQSNYGHGAGWTKKPEQYTRAPHNKRSTFKDPGYRHGLKNKDLNGMSWMIALALRADGWYLRSDIIWSKPNPMPESVQDRPTKSHEYIFLLAKSPDYYYDAEAIKTLAKNPADDLRRIGGVDPTTKRQVTNKINALRVRETATATANKRSVWTMPTEAFPEAHYATFPEDLIVDCIKAGSSEHGCCTKCGKPYKRMVQKKLVPTAKAAKTFVVDSRDLLADRNDQGSNRARDGHKSGHVYETKTLGWKRTCKCKTKAIEPAVVFDPFMGRGTTMVVARKLQRNAIGFELSEKSVKIANRWVYKKLGMFA